MSSDVKAHAKRTLTTIVTYQYATHDRFDVPLYDDKKMMRAMNFFQYNSIRIHRLQRGLSIYSVA